MRMCEMKCFIVSYRIDSTHKYEACVIAENFSKAEENFLDTHPSVYGDMIKNITMLTQDVVVDMGNVVEKIDEYSYLDETPTYDKPMCGTSIVTMRDVEQALGY